MLITDLSEICGKREDERELTETAKKIAALGLRIQGLDTGPIKVSLLKNLYLKD